MEPPIPVMPSDEDCEKASNGYLMSLVVLMVGMPLPVVNLISNIIYFFAHRRSSYFVRWHATQALLAQLAIIPLNSAGVYWTLSIVFGNNTVTNSYIAYMLTLMLFNMAEFVATIYAAIRTRRGAHLALWLFGPATTVVCKP